MYFLVHLDRLFELSDPDVEVLTGQSSVILRIRHEELEGEPAVEVEVMGARHGDRVGFDVDRLAYRVTVGGRVAATHELRDDRYDYYVKEAKHLLDALAELRAPVAS